MLNWWLFHKCSNEALLWHSWYIKDTFIATQNTHWIQQFVLAASEEGHSFMVHNGRKIKWFHSQRHSTNWTMIVHTTYCIYSTQYSTLGCLRCCGPDTDLEGNWTSFHHNTHTYQQIHWSDCQYRRPGSCNLRTRSQWISPFLTEERERRGSSYQDNMMNAS